MFNSQSALNNARSAIVFRIRPKAQRGVLRRLRDTLGPSGPEGSIAARRTAILGRASGDRPSRENSLLPRRPPRRRVEASVSSWWWRDFTDRPPAGNFTSSSPAVRPGYAVRGSPLRPARVRRAREDLVRRAGCARGSGPAGRRRGQEYHEALSGPRRRPRRPGRPRPPRRALRTALGGRWPSAAGVSSGRGVASTFAASVRPAAARCFSAAVQWSAGSGAPPANSAATPTPNPAAIAVRVRVLVGSPRRTAPTVFGFNEDRDANSPCVQPRRSRCARIPTAYGSSFAASSGTPASLSAVEASAPPVEAFSIGSSRTFDAWLPRPVVMTAPISTARPFSADHSPRVATPPCSSVTSEPRTKTFVLAPLDRDEPVAPRRRLSGNRQHASQHRPSLPVPPSDPLSVRAAIIFKRLAHRVPTVGHRREGSRGFTLGGGRLSLRPSVEVGLRRDGGDAETGAGMDEELPRLDRRADRRCTLW